jgi:hypothetical protein
MRIARSPHRLSSGLLAVALVLTGAAACTDDDDEATSSEPAPEPSASATASGPLRLWPIPSDPLEKTKAAGLEAETRETLTYHVHAHLDIFIDGVPVFIPSGIGINIADPGVKTFGSGDNVGYGGIEGCDTPCISPLHTHDPDGIIHTESADNTPNTLGQFFTEWGVTFTAECLADHCEGLAVYVDGTRESEDPTRIELLDRREIAIVIGRPPAEIPSRADFSNA